MKSRFNVLRGLFLLTIGSLLMSAYVSSVEAMSHKKNAIFFNKTHSSTINEDSVYSVFDLNPISNISCGQSLQHCIASSEQLFQIFPDDDYPAIEQSFYLTHDFGKTWNKIAFPADVSFVKMYQSDWWFQGCDDTGLNCLIFMEDIAPKQGVLSDIWSIQTSNGGQSWFAEKSMTGHELGDFSYISLLTCSKNLEDCWFMVDRSHQVEHEDSITVSHQITPYFSMNKGKTWQQGSVTARMPNTYCKYNQDYQLFLCDGLAFSPYQKCTLNDDKCMTAFNPIALNREAFPTSCDSTFTICYGVAGDIDDDSSIYERHHVYKSSDGGSTWQKTGELPKPNEAKRFAVNSVDCNYQTQHCVAVGGYQTEDNKYYPLSYISDNGGMNWSLSEYQPELPGNALTLLTEDEDIKEVIYGNDIPPNFLTHVSCQKDGDVCIAGGSYLSSNALDDDYDDDYDNNHKNIFSMPTVYRTSDGGHSWLTTLINIDFVHMTKKRVMSR